VSHFGDKGQEFFLEAIGKRAGASGITAKKRKNSRYCERGTHIHAHGGGGAKHGGTK